jgi:hypothetical protein
MLYKVLQIIILSFIPVLVHAGGAGFGNVATNLMDPVSVMADFVHSGCVLIGGAFLFATIVKYIEHRRSPTMVPISTVWFLLIAGIILISLPLISYVTTNGVPFPLMK